MGFSSKKIYLGVGSAILYGSEKGRYKDGIGDFKPGEKFLEIVREVEEVSKYDPELHDGLNWIRNEAVRRNISYHQMIFYVLYDHDISSKANNWMRGI